MKKIGKILTLCLPLFMVAACDMTMPSQVKTAKIEVGEEMKTKSWSANSIDRTALDNLARDYRLNGKGPVRAVISYKDGGPADEIAAKKQAADYIRAFKSAGVPLTASVVPVPDAATAGRAVISYNAMTASRPQDCTRMTGYDGAGSLTDVKQYEMGCEVKHYMSQMVVRSEDLLGGQTAIDTETRRAGTTVEKYKNGVKNEKIQGINASDVGGGG